MRLTTVNVNGLRAAARKGFFEWLPQHRADLVCLQEIRIQEHQLTAEMRAAAGMHSWYMPAEKPGYSGVAFFSRHEPDRVHQGIGNAEFDREGRLLALDFGPLRVASLYLPSGSSREDRQVFKYRFMDLLLEWLQWQRESTRHLVVCGDWNIAHRKIDLKNWRGNQDRSGFLPQEREWMDGLFGAAGWHDVYRRLYPQAEGEAYTWWSNRGRAWDNNTGWRIDYQVADAEFAALAQQGSVYKEQRFSDHAPLTVDYDYSL